LTRVINAAVVCQQISYVIYTAYIKPTDLGRQKDPANTAVEISELGLSKK